MTGIEMIAAERGQHFFREKFDAAHDDRHTGGELADGAACYVIAAGEIARGAKASDLHAKDEECDDGYVGKFAGYHAAPSWPFAPAELKLCDNPIENLVKAGAMIAAEIDRLQRLAASNS